MEGRERFSRALPTGGAGGGVGRRFVLDALERGIFSFSFVFGFARASRGMPRVGQWGSYGGGVRAKEPKRTRKSSPLSSSPSHDGVGFDPRFLLSPSPTTFFLSETHTHTHVRVPPAHPHNFTHPPHKKRNTRTHTHTSLSSSHVVDAPRSTPKCGAWGRAPASACPPWAWGRTWAAWLAATAWRRPCRPC